MSLRGAAMPPSAEAADESCGELATPPSPDCYHPAMSADVGVLARALRMLRQFSEDDEALTAAQLSDRAGLARSTGHRLALELAELGLLDRRPDGAFTIGLGLWELGELAPVSMRLRERALPHLTRLYEASGENVHLAVLSDDAPMTAEALFVGRITGPRAIPTLGRMGGRHPLHATGVGKAILARRSDPWLEAFLQRPLERETVHTITDPIALRADLDRTRQRGVAVTRQEMTLGNISVAAAIPVPRGMRAAAIGVVAHLARADERRLAQLVLEAAAGIAADVVRP